MLLAPCTFIAYFNTLSIELARYWHNTINIDYKSSLTSRAPSLCWWRWVPGWPWSPGLTSPEAPCSPRMLWWPCSQTGDPTLFLKLNVPALTHNIFFPDTHCITSHCTADNLFCPGLVGCAQYAPFPPGAVIGDLASGGKTPWNGN